MAKSRTRAKADKAEAVGRKNLIINGAMQVAQRGTSAVAIGAPSFPSIDRFKCYKQSDGGTITSEQSAEAPDGFYYSMKATVTSADATPTGVNSISYWVEGYDAQHLGFGTASAQTCTISFWVKSSIVGTYSVAIQDNDYAVSYVAEYSISSPNTWEQKTVTFAGPTAGSWGKTSAASGVRIWWDIGSGDSDTVSTVNQWTGRGFRSTSSVRLIETSGATFQITGVQLELGSVATDFEHRSYGEELALCHRYYYKKSTNADEEIVRGYNLSTSSFYGTTQIPVPMRASPSGTLTTSNNRFRGNGTNVSNATVTLNTVEYATGSNQVKVVIVGSGLSSAVAHQYTYTSTAASTFELDAEL